MAYLYEACDQISDFCHQQLLTDGRTDGQTEEWTEVKQYTPPLRWSEGINMINMKRHQMTSEGKNSFEHSALVSKKFTYYLLSKFQLHKFDQQQSQQSNLQGLHNQGLLLIFCVSSQDNNLVCNLCGHRLIGRQKNYTSRIQ